MPQIESAQRRKCKQCAKPFRVTRAWMVFCCDTCRVRFNRTFKEICFYCGSLGTHRDHVTPHVFATVSHKRMYQGVEVVWACAECNQTLNGRLMRSIEERLEFLIERYRNKYQLDKTLPDWEETELVELGRNLRARVRKLLRKREQAFERYVYLQAHLEALQKDGEI